MKIDLHCHTKKTKSGDPPSRNVDAKTFSDKVLNSDVKIVAITNHNHFDYDQYIQLSSAVCTFCQVWPGIELDILSSSKKRWHLIVISNPDEIKAFLSAISTLISGNNPDVCSWDLASVHNAFESCDVIYIPHFHKKPAIPEEDIDELYGLVKEKWRIFNEAPDYKSLGVFANHEYSVRIGTAMKTRLLLICVFL